MTLKFAFFFFFTALFRTHVQGQVPSPPPPPPPPPPRSPPPPPSPPAPPPPACFSSFQCPRLQGCYNGVCLPLRICFPGDATVETLNGVKHMKELRVGDKVMAGKSRDGAVYSDVYAFGHKDHESWSDFIQVKVASSNSVNILELSSGHFVPTFSEGKTINKRAKDVRVGDKVWSTFQNMSGLFTVEALASVHKEGLFNPLTLSGTIVVNGVQASVHSDWFLDSLVDALGMTEWLPGIYQALLLPARLMFYVLGSKVYSTIYEFADNYVKFAEVGAKFAGEVALAFAITTMVTAKRVLSKFSRRF